MGSSCSEFKLDTGLVSSINEAKQKYTDAVSKLRIKNFNLDLFGKKMLKKINIGPDSLMQAAFQVKFFL